jgi:hypothetical protein
MERCLASLWGALSIAFHVLCPFLRPWRTKWGTTAEERALVLPGDDLVPVPRWSYVHAMTIDTPPAAVWPWIAQLGQEHAGFYSYEGLENLFGCRIHNASRIHPEWQHPQVGDLVYLHPRVPPLPITRLEPGRLIVLGGPPDAQGAQGTWGFYLLAGPNGTTRLLERGRNAYPADAGMGTKLIFGPMLIEPISFVMSRRMLRIVKRLAEANWKRPNTASDCVKSRFAENVAKENQ